MTTGNTEIRDLQPTILSFVKDLPNLCSLAGLACTILSIYFSILGIYYAAMIGMIWAVAFYEFTRTMESYKYIIAANTTLVLSTDSELFKFLKGMDPDPGVKP